MGNCEAARVVPRPWRLCLLASAVLGASCGCEKAPSEPPVPPERSKRFLEEIPLPDGTEWLHTCGEKLAAVSHESTLYVWAWNDLQEPPIEGEGEDSSTAFLSPDFIVAEWNTLRKPYDPSHPVLLKDLHSGKELRRWTLGGEWYCYGLRTSRNGRYVALHARSNSPPRQVRLGLLQPQNGDLQWAASIRQRRGTLMVSHAAPSEDGRYVAAAGIHDGAWIAVADVQARKALWDRTQDGAVKFYDVAFSPDSKTVYAGGTSGGLFAYDVQTGKLTGRWRMGQGLDTEYGYRITRVAASLDGRLVAAGTGPDGHVYLWSVETGEQVAVLQTRQATVMGLAFSPDSARLAVTGVANRSIEIWDVTQE